MINSAVPFPSVAPIILYGMILYHFKNRYKDKKNIGMKKKKIDTDSFDYYLTIKS